MHGEDDVVSLVPSLRCPARPDAIAWMIASVVVDSLDGQTRRALAHVLKEFGKISPSFADSDPAPCPLLKMFVVWVETPGHHVAPCFVCPITDTINLARQSMLFRHPLNFRGKASARTGCSASNVAIVKKHDLSAETFELAGIGGDSSDEF